MSDGEARRQSRDDGSESRPRVLDFSGNDPAAPSRNGARQVSASVGDASRAPLEMRCEELHPIRCAQLLQANSPAEMVNVAREHGALIHGFTPVWYDQERLTSMSTTVARRLQ
jgi:hypothetical protein